MDNIPLLNLYSLLLSTTLGVLCWVIAVQGDGFSVLIFLAMIWVVTAQVLIFFFLLRVLRASRSSFEVSFALLGLKLRYVIEFFRSRNGGIKLQKPNEWKYHTDDLTRSKLKELRDVFWKTAPSLGGNSEVWNILRQAVEADVELGQALLTNARIVLVQSDMGVCYDESGFRYALPKYVISDPTNLLEGSIKLQKPGEWKFSGDHLTRSKIKELRDLFWDTAPSSGGNPAVWKVLRQAVEADVDLGQTLLTGAGVVLEQPDMTFCHDESGFRYAVPTYILSDPTNLLEG